MARSYQRNMSQGGAQQRMGLLDLFPSLGQWVQGNRDALMAPYAQNAAAQAESLLGAPAASFQQVDPSGLTSGVSSQGSGLMADPADFFKQMQYAQGLMGTPGYESAGQNFASQAMSHQLGSDARDQVQENWQANQQRQAAQAQATLQQSQANADRTYGGTQATQAARVKNDYLTQSTGMASDANAILKPIREAVQLYSNVNQTVADKGFVGMTVTDDTVMVKTLAKLMLPQEAVMEGDIAAITTLEGIPAAVRGIARKLSMGSELTTQERQQIYDQVQRMGGNRFDEYQQTRQDFEGRAQRAKFDPRDVLRSAPEFNTTDARGPGGGDGSKFPNLKGKLDSRGRVKDPDLIRRLNEQSSREHPNMVQRFGNWLAE